MALSWRGLLYALLAALAAGAKSMGGAIDMAAIVGEREGGGAFRGMDFTEDDDEFSDDDEFGDDPLLDGEEDAAEMLMNEYDEDGDDQLSSEELLGYFIFDGADGKNVDKSLEDVKQQIFDADEDQNGGLDIDELTTFLAKLDADV
mmetsp:Transcript_43879/g.87196  ORF Transcript_43879/g.87196 Transcript_43879/m.87196 type:complete len:146 (+) Transcript_43879:82-519(+)